MLNDDGKQKVNTYLKFTSIALQMAILITAAAFGGRWLDEKQENEMPIWTLVLILIAIFASLYQIIREVIKMGKDND
jgi:membrane protein DedA with SNARE-associated domain